MVRWSPLGALGFLWDFTESLKTKSEKEASSKTFEIRIFGARNGNFERNAVVKNQGTKQRGQRILGGCWQWEANGQCSKGDNCSFRHDNNKRAKMTQPNPSPNSFMQQREKSIENPKSQGEEPQW